MDVWSHFWRDADCDSPVLDTGWEIPSQKISAIDLRLLRGVLDYVLVGDD